MRIQKSLTWIGVLAATMALCAPALAASPGQGPGANRNAPPAQPKDRQLKIGPVKLMQEKVQVKDDSMHVSTGWSVKGLGRFAFGTYEKAKPLGSNARGNVQATEYVVEHEKGVHVKIGPKTIRLPTSSKSEVVKVPLPFGFRASPKAASPAPAAKPAPDAKPAQSS